MVNFGHIPVVGSFEYLWFGRYGSALRASVGRSAEIVAAFYAYSELARSSIKQNAHAFLGNQNGQGQTNE